MSRRKQIAPAVRSPVAWLAVVLAASLALAGCGGGDGGESASSSTPRVETGAEGAPPKLAAIHEQQNELLEGGPSAFEDRLAELRGFPVVVNKWASWCGPCRAEFPYFQSQASEHGDEIAFLGVNSNDGEDSARDFLAEFPVPYPSYLDPKLEIAAVFDAAVEFPATAFYDSKGEVAYVRRGGYASEDELAADIERYAK